MSATSIIEKFAFQPPFPPTPIPNGPKFLKNSDGEKIAYYSLTSNSSPYVVLFSHGNACDLGMCLSQIEYLNQSLGVSVFSYDYLGYGFSDNPEDQSSSIRYRKYPSEEGCYQSIKTVYQYLTKVEKIPSKNIILMGQSIGSGPTVDLATKYPVGGVILISPFKSAAKVVSDSWLLSFFDIFKNDNKLEYIKAPVFIIHGTDDEVVGIEHSKQLYSQINSKYRYPPLWIRGAGHNDIFGNKLINGIKKFIQHLE